ncbi:single-stranded DNA-binding protein [Corynebacterium sp. 13CS0277]|uniref:single-stranded DNA-binding protein n=1 Tax=Corynebacterium sp. 13CS0277 TaxID=2071994 RepID=UPI001304A6FC|nr:single-stranded DNA-binding protein [Corynebacterium sp. 13CS0277]
MIQYQTFIGRLVADPDLRFTPNGKAVAEFRIAESDSHKDERGNWQTTKRLFIPCAAWGELAESVNAHLRKGDRVAVTGKLETQEWEAKDGTSRSRIMLNSVVGVYRHVDRVQGPNNNTGGGGGGGWGSATRDEAPPF